MNPWDLDQTRAHVLRLYGREQLEMARPCLRSVDDRQYYAHFHYKDAVDLLDSYVAANLQEDRSILPFFACDDNSDEFNIFIRKVGAHLVACIQSMHAVPDILAHAIYYSLNINHSEHSLLSRDINLNTVIKTLNNQADAGVLKQFLIDIRDEGAFDHLSALSNHAKHRSIVFPSLNEDWSGERAERHTVLFPAFMYKNVDYPRVVAKDFLAAEFDRCSRLSVLAGNELNELLGRRAP